MAEGKKVKVEITRSPMALRLAYHPGQTPELSEALAKELVNKGFAEYPEDIAAAKKPDTKKKK